MPSARLIDGTGAVYVNHGVFRTLSITTQWNFNEAQENLPLCGGMCFERLC